MSNYDFEYEVTVGKKSLGKLFCVACNMSDTPSNRQAVIDAVDEWGNWPSMKVPTPHTYLCVGHLLLAESRIAIMNAQYRRATLTDRPWIKNEPMAEIISITKGRK